MDQVVENIKHITSFPLDGDATSREKCRKMILDVLHDFTKGKHDKYSSVMEMIFHQILTHQLANCPDKFVVVDHDTDVSLDDEERKCYEFTSEIVYHSLILLSQPRSVDLYPSAGKFITKLLQKIKSIDPCLFKKVVAELVFCIGDLVAIETDIYSTGIPENPELKRVLHIFTDTSQVPQHENSDMKRLVIQDLDSCNRLQIAISKILLEVASDVCQYTTDRVQHMTTSNTQILWASMCYQLEYGGIELKTVSLNMLTEFLSLLGLPEPVVLDYFIDCLVALVELLSSGSQPCPGDYESLELALTKNLNRVLSACYRPDIVNHSTEQLYESLAMGISESVTIHGLAQIHTPLLKSTLCDTLTEVSNRLKKAGYFNVILQNQMRKSLDHIIQEIGMSKDSQYMVGFVTSSHLHDLPQIPKSSVSRVHDLGGATQGPLRSVRREHKDKSSSNRQKSEIDDTESVWDVLYTHKALMARLRSLCMTLQNDQNPSEVQLEGIRVSLDILAYTKIRLPDAYIRERFASDALLSEATVFELINTWKTVLLHPTQTTDKDISLFYGYIVRGIGALLQLIDVGSTDMAIQQYFVWVLSVPWLLSELSWKDLKPPEAREITSLANKIADKIDVKSQAVCVKLLAALPKTVSPMWRAHVIHLTIASIDTEVRCSAVRSLPVYLCRSGPNANHLVQDFIHPMLKDPSETIQEALAQCLGPLACVLSRKALVHRQSSGTSEEPSYGSVCILCTVCHKHIVHDSDKTNKERGRTVEAKMFVPFVEAMVGQTASLIKAKIDMLKGFPQMLAHIGLTGNNTQAVKFVSTCMELMKDPEYSVRLEFSKVVKHFVTTDRDDGNLNLNRYLISNLNKITQHCHMPDNLHMLDTLLLTVGEIAKVGDEELLISMLKILLDQVCLKSSQLAWAVAYGQMKEIASYRKQKETRFNKLYGRKLYKVLVDHLHDAQSGVLDRDPLDILSDVTKFFGFPDDTKSFLKNTDHLLLPHIVKKATPAASALLRIVGKQLNNANHRCALNQHTRHIFCHLVCSCEGDELSDTLTFLEKEMEWQLGDILKAQSNVNFELLLHLASDHNKVIKGLKIIISHTVLKKPPKSLDDISTNMLVNALQPCLLGILVHFDNYLNNCTYPLKERYKAYMSLVPLMKLMGTEHITKVRVRLMTTLKIGLNFKECGFPELCCTAWNCFVHTLDLSSVGSLLSQIVINLLPLIQSQPHQTVPILEYLIIENRAVLEQHFHELYFLPDSPQLSEINSVLKTYTEAVYQSQGLATRMEHLLKGVTHESLDVRQLALTKLKTLLRCNQESLQKLVLSSETVDPIVSLIVKNLLEGCRESDQTVRNLYAECLGELGAIDPGRLDLLSNQPKQDITKFCATVTEDNFAYGFLNELAKSFLRADERTMQDCVAFAIQELIQSFEISRNDDSVASGAVLWRRFDDEVKEILMPLFESKYAIMAPYDWSNYQLPIYRSKKCNSFERWVSTLTGYFAAKVQSDKPRRILEACQGVLKYVSQIALYMLPHIIIHVLLENREEDHQQVVQEILLVLNDVGMPDTRHASASEMRYMSAQTVFSVLDHLTTWCRHRLMVISHPQRGRVTSLSADKMSTDPGYQCIQTFLSKIPQDLLARASYNCGAFTRALMHFVQYLKSLNCKVHTQDNYDFLQKLYIALHEPDGVTGITAIKQSAPTLAEQIKAYESLGQLSDASVCYDQAIQLEPDNISYRQGLLCCRLALGEFQSAMGQANGMISENPNWSSQLNAYRIEAAWKLGQWDKLDIYLHPEDKSIDWNVGLGKILLAAKNKNENEVRSLLNVLRCQQMAPLSAASMEVGSYQRGYEYIVRLHILNEIELGMTTLFNFSLSQDMTQSGQLTPLTVLSLIQRWDHRLQFTQASYQTQEPILNVRRIMLSLARQDYNLQVEHETGQTWLEMAKIARECGFIQTAHSSLLSASTYNPPDYCLENAKWFWDRGDYDKAQACLEQAIDLHHGDRDKWKTADYQGSNEERLACAKILLLLGRYCEETASWESNAIMRQYREVQQVHGEWEDAYFYIGKYYDKIMVQLIETEKPEKKGEFIVKVVQNFGNSLMHGSQYIYQSMPRMLTLWLDYGSEAVTQSSKMRNETQLHSMRAVVNHLNLHMGNFCKNLAPYQFLTAFPQLISRICHAHPEVFNQLKDIIATLLVEFPQQAMWMMMAVSKSSYQMRVRRCLEIFHKAKDINKNLNKFLQDATKLADRLLDLCNRNIEAGGATTLSITQHFKPLHRLIDDSKFSPILLPLQSLMTPLLPSGSVSPNTHNCFPGNQVYIKGIEDTVEVLPSLQRPKKLTFRGSDGHLYLMMCKPKDDLRKDGRLMEFNSIINKCLRKSPEARRRDLHIRTYTVTPLNEECGLLEWVTSTHGLRHIIMKLYKERGIYTSGKELKAMQLPPKAEYEKKREVYVEKLLPRHPALFSEWFLKTFPDPTSWYNARLAYSRTVAVMSMVGYVLGLGDRHGENILFDSMSGDCVHVDFNCLFNKGETFDYPEIVPFRLTHNMIEAMGPMGYEGVFRRACEVTLRVMRDQTDPLLSVLRTFIYDPLVEWSKPPSGRGKSNPSDTGETKNEKAQTHIVNIESRLRGVLKNKTKPRGLPLSVEGQVNHLIKEATDVHNLCQMYIGWAAYM